MDRDVLHERVLMSVYKAITKEEHLPPRFGPRWETIGFQGDDPATDLRGAGMLALLQLRSHDRASVWTSLVEERRMATRPALMRAGMEAVCDLNLMGEPSGFGLVD